MTAALAAPPRVSLKQVLALAAPTSVLAVLQVAAQLVETALAARQGTAAPAGWAVLLPFALLQQQMSASAMGGGVVSVVARALGAQRRDEASALVLHALIIALAARTLVLMWPAFPFLAWLLAEPAGLGPHWPWSRGSPPSRWR